MTNHIVIRIGWVLGLVLAGCGGGGDDPAAEECRDLVSLACNRFEECDTPPGITVDDCIDQSEDALPGDGCADADQVSASYGACIDTLTTISCADLAPGGTPMLPAECANTVLFEQ